MNIVADYWAEAHPLWMIPKKMEEAAWRAVNKAPLLGLQRREG